MIHTWDAEKNRRNVARRGLALEDAIGIFEGPTFERADDRFEYGEVRIYAVGVVNGVEITYTDVSRDGAANHFGLKGRAA